MPHPGSIKQVTLEQAKEIIAEDMPSRVIRMVILHHFWKPRAKHYRGRRTMASVRRHHVRNRGWRDVGYNWLLGPDGSIWTGRTLQRHGAHCIGHNSDSVGIGMCLNGDIEHLGHFELMQRSMLQLTAALCQQFSLNEGDFHFHRDFADKSCPGELLDRAQYRRILRTWLIGEQDEWVRLKVNDVPVRDVHGRPLELVNDSGTVRAQRHQDAEYRGLGGMGVWLQLQPGDSLRAKLEADGCVIPPHGWHGDHGPAGTIYCYGPTDVEFKRTDDNGQMPR